jgi:hypothetical protein
LPERWEQYRSQRIADASHRASEQKVNLRIASQVVRFAQVSSAKRGGIAERDAIVPADKSDVTVNVAYKFVVAAESTGNK